MKMAELPNLWLRPCVVWETPLPTRGIPCTSRDFFLRSSKCYLRLDMYRDVSYGLYIYNENLPKEESFTVTSFVHDPNRHTPHVLKFAETVVGEWHTTLWSGSRNDIAECIGDFKEGEGRLKIVCLFNIASETKIECNNETIHLQGSSDQSNTKSSVDKCVQTGPSVAGKLESLSLDFCNLLEHETFADVKLRCGDRTVAAHRAVLAARSEVFAAMFRNKMAESETGIVDVTDLDASHLDLFMKYVYSGEIPDLSEDVAQILYAAGDKYAVHSLKEACSEWIVGNLTEENCLGSLIVADRHSDEGLKESVVNFIVEKLGVLRKEAWSRFSEEHPSLAVIVYQKHCAATLSKQA